MTHEAFEVSFDPAIPAGHCGPLQVNAVVNCDGLVSPCPIFSENLALSSNPISYDPSTRQIAVFADTEAYIGIYTVTISAHFLKYPDRAKETFSFGLSILEIPCKRPRSIQATPLLDQNYIITDRVLEYQVEPFITDPEDCIVTYDFMSSPPFGSGVFQFDPKAGSFSFYADDDIDLSNRGYNI